jgi:alpha-galactosidase
MKRIITVLALCALSAVSAPSASAEQEPVRINYPRIFGVRPGSPFLFHVPVSGSRPFTVTAQGLPGGLSLDPATGIVRGVIEDLEKKTHTVTFTARNALGSSTQMIRFVVGERICLTPPMGWNSWYVWCHDLTEQHFRDAATAFERNGLAGHGWSYISLDDCWQGQRAGPDKGRALQPNAKFPDIKGAVDYIHSLGFKAGIYTTPWVGSYAFFCGGTCDNAEGNIGGLAPDKCPMPGRIYAGDNSVHRVGPHWFMEADIQQMADWGFDLVKVDWTPNDLPTTSRVSKIVRAQKRDLALSLSNEASFQNAAEYAKLAEMWRTTGDNADVWSHITDLGFAQLPWAPYAGPGHWNDSDMLMFGYLFSGVDGGPRRHTNLTRDEQRSKFTIWCLNASPLIISSDPDRLDGFTLSMMSNDEVIAVDQDPLGKPAKEMPPQGALRLFVREMEDGALVLGVINMGEACVEKIPWAKFGLAAEPRAVRDLWANHDLVAADHLLAALPAHASLLLRTMSR